MFTTLIPAYGRDYKSAKAVRDAWNEGKDFQISNAFSPDDGRYVNKSDAAIGQKFNIRYNGLRSIAVITNK